MFFQAAGLIPRPHLLWFVVPLVTEALSKPGPDATA